MSSGMLRRVALVRTDVSEEPSASFITAVKTSNLTYMLCCIIAKGGKITNFRTCFITVMSMGLECN
jgi:hypothetical protein